MHPPKKKDFWPHTPQEIMTISWPFQRVPCYEPGPLGTAADFSKCVWRKLPCPRKKPNPSDPRDQRRNRRNPRARAARELWSWVKFKSSSSVWHWIWVPCRPKMLWERREKCWSWEHWNLFWMGVPKNAQPHQQPSGTRYRSLNPPDPPHFRHVFSCLSSTESPNANPSC